MTDWNQQLFNAAKTNNLPKVVEALDAGAYVNRAGENNDTPLMHAASMGYSEIVNVLLERGADMNMQTRDTAETALHFAIAYKNEACVHALLDHGADTNIAAGRHGTALIYAASLDMPDIVQRLLENGADPNVRDGDQKTAAQVAIENGQSGVLGILLGALPDSGSKQSELDGMLSIAAACDELKTVETLLKAGANPNAVDANGVAPLINASALGFTKIVHHLLLAGAEVDATDKRGNTALCFAVDKRASAAAQLLLAAGADPNRKNEHGAPLLVNVAHSGQLATGLMLLVAGADINALSPRSRTALHWAAAEDKVDLVRGLLAAGADVNVMDNEKKTPLTLAKEGKHKEIQGLLKAASRGKRPTIEQTKIPEFSEELTKWQRVFEHSGTATLEQEHEVVPLLPVGTVIGESKRVVGENTRRLLQANQEPRAENDALESLLTQVLEDKFLAELIYRNGYGPEQFSALDNAGVSVVRRYENGPEPKWQVELWTGSGQEDLARSMDAISEKLDEVLGVKTSAARRGQKAIFVPFHENLDEVVEAFNSALSDPVTKIDMNELRVAASAQVQAKQSQQQNLGR